MSRASVRPLLTNAIIKIDDGVEFKWLYKQSKENNGGDANGMIYLNWSVTVLTTNNN